MDISLGRKHIAYSQLEGPYRKPLPYETAQSDYPRRLSESRGVVRPLKGEYETAAKIVVTRDRPTRLYRNVLSKFVGIRLEIVRNSLVDDSSVGEHVDSIRHGER